MRSNPAATHFHTTAKSKIDEDISSSLVVAIALGSAALFAYVLQHKPSVPRENPCQDDRGILKPHLVGHCAVGDPLPAVKSLCATADSITISKAKDGALTMKANWKSPEEHISARFEKGSLTSLVDHVALRDRGSAKVREARFVLDMRYTEDPVGYVAESEPGSSTKSEELLDPKEFADDK